MKLLLTSGIEFSKKDENGERKSVRINNKDFIRIIKENIVSPNNLLFICSSPDDYEKNEKFKDIIEKSLSLSGIKFEYSDLIDSRNWLFTKSLVTNSDLIILMGGDPIEQMEFFNNIELKDKIKKCKGIVMGISAGTINMANYAYCSKDKDVKQSVYYRGLGLTDINVEPHFKAKSFRRIKDVLIPDSKNRPFIALPDKSFIFNDGKENFLYGDAYYFSNGEYKLITDLKQISQNKTRA